MPKHLKNTHAAAELPASNPLRAVDSSALEIPGYPPPLTKEQLAEHLQCGERTIDNLMASRRIPFIKLGRLVRFNIVDVQKALRRYTVQEVTLS